MTQIGTGSPGFGALHPGLQTTRDAQSTIKLLQKIHGDTLVLGPSVLTARPVPGCDSAGQVRFDSGQRPARDGADPPHADPRLTGPRPTFARTPLEKMQSDRFRGLSEGGTAAPSQDDAEPDPHEGASEPDRSLAPPGSARRTADRPGPGAIQHARDGFAASVFGEKPQPCLDALK